MSVVFKNRVPITSRNTEPPPRWRYQVARQIKTLSFSVIGLSALLFVGNVSAELSVEPVSHDFGSITVDASSADKKFTLINESDSSLQLGLIDELGNVTTTIDEFGTGDPEFWNSDWIAKLIKGMISKSSRHITKFINGCCHIAKFINQSQL
jgi:hypothetical protein